MSDDWEAILSRWGKAPSQTQQDKAENAVTAVMKAISASDTLAAHTIDVFVQGSYANRTNVRQDSDVDICVCYTDAFFSDYSMSDGLSNEVLGLGDASLSYADFKDAIGDALEDYFGKSSISRGSKAFDVHENTYRIDADVVPAFEHRRYLGNKWQNSYVKPTGTQIMPDTGGLIRNWPRQNYSNGVSKNTDTNRTFKSTVRMLKTLHNKMVEDKMKAADPIPSYLIECLVWNVPNQNLGQSTSAGDLRGALAHLWNNTRTQEACKEWGEINELKYLFHSSQPWKREVVNGFLQAAWDYVGFE
jgi:predicted nucleotidyltransferase